MCGVMEVQGGEQRLQMMSFFLFCNEIMSINAISSLYSASVFS